jgi:hypothetical protein
VNNTSLAVPQTIHPTCSGTQWHAATGLPFELAAAADLPSYLSLHNSHKAKAKANKNPSSLEGEAPLNHELSCANVPICFA